MSDPTPTDHGASPRAIAMLREMDWKTPAGKARLGSHGRIVLTCAVGAAIAWFVLQARFPHTLWFTRLWTALAIGGAAGWILGTIWQAAQPARRAATCGRFILTGLLFGGLFGAVGLFFQVPEMRAQETELAGIRNLTAADVIAIDLQTDHHPPVHITAPDAIAAFISHTRQATLFYPSHEGAVLRLQLTIVRRDGNTRQYDGAVREQHPDDIVLDFRGNWEWSNLRLPGARRWLDAMTSP